MHQKFFYPQKFLMTFFLVIGYFFQNLLPSLKIYSLFFLTSLLFLSIFLSFSLFLLSFMFFLNQTKIKNSPLTIGGQKWGLPTHLNYWEGACPGCPQSLHLCLAA